MLNEIMSVETYHVEFLVLEHGLLGRHTDLDFVGQSTLDRLMQQNEVEHSYVSNAYQRMQFESKQREECGVEEGKQNAAAKKKYFYSSKSVHLPHPRTGYFSPGRSGQRQIEVLNHAGNNGYRAFVGVNKCGQRLSKYVVEQVKKSVREHQAKAHEVAAKADTSDELPQSRPPSVDYCQHRNYERRGSSLSGGGLSPKTSPFFPNASNAHGGRPMGSETQKESLASENDAPIRRLSEGSSPRKEGKKELWVLTFHFLGYSIGGLIIRSALPSIINEIESYFLHDVSKAFAQNSASRKEKKKSSSRPVMSPHVVNDDRSIAYQIEWKNVFFLCTPHLGSAWYYPSMQGYSRMFRILSTIHLLPRMIEDVTLRNDFVEVALLSKPYLDALRRFQKKLFVTLINDRMVWNYSAAFFLPPNERRYLDEGVVDNPVLNPEALDMKVNAGCYVDKAKKDVPWLLYNDEEEKKELEAYFSSSLRLTPSRCLKDMTMGAREMCQKCAKPPPLSAMENKLALGNPMTLMDVNEESDSHQVVETTALDWEENWINPLTWPEHYLPRERRMALTLLSNIGPVEVRVADLYPSAAHFVNHRIRNCDLHVIRHLRQFFSLLVFSSHQLVLVAITSPEKRCGMLEAEEEHDFEPTSTENSENVFSTSQRIPSNSISQSEGPTEDQNLLSVSEEEIQAQKSFEKAWSNVCTTSSPFRWVLDYLVQRILDTPKSTMTKESLSRRSKSLSTASHQTTRKLDSKEHRGERKK